MRIIKPLIIIAVAVLTGWGCSPETPSSSAVETYPGELSKSEYNSLSAEQKYQVSNKLLSTMFKGVSVDEFFDLSNGLASPQLKEGKDFVYNAKLKLSTVQTDEERAAQDILVAGYDDTNDANDVSGLFRIFTNNNEDWPKHLPLGRIYQYPLSKDMFDQWVAYVLVNTILFSPAEEIDSTSIRDVQKVFNKLVDDLNNDRSVREIISRHQKSQENWRRFRSPEDNTREMIEIYLGLFDRDADVPKASKACKDLYLSDEDNGYELLSTGFPNTEPQYVLDTYVTTCNDFYEVVASHPLVIPRVTTVLVEYFFYTKTGDERAQIVNRIVSANPTTFQQIFKSIVFSREYLLNNERAKSFEENFFGTAQRLKWSPHSDLLQQMTASSNEMMSIEQMSWPTMSLKLGRFTGVPLDSLSFANYHRAYREGLLLDGNNGNVCGASDCTNCGSGECRWRYGLGLEQSSDPGVLADNATEQQAIVHQAAVSKYQQQMNTLERVQNLGLNDYIDYLFLSVLERKATDVEKTDLIAYYQTRSFVDLVDGEFVIDDRDYPEMAQVAFDYMSRIHETYYHLSVN